MAGYSKRSLVDKLGIKSGCRIYFENAPSNYSNTLGPLPDNTTVLSSLQAPLDVIQFFATRRAELEARFPFLKQALAQTGMLWISWPKGAAKVSTVLNENVVRVIGLKNYLVDVKVCAVDDVWSGLKFVYRLQERK